MLIKKIATIAGQLWQLMQTIEESQTLLNDTDCEEELKELAKLEKEEAEEITKSRTEYAPRPTPPDPVDNRNVIIETRAGNWWRRGRYFCGDLYRMYTRYFDLKGWKHSMMDANPSESVALKKSPSPSRETKYIKL